ncbi:unnamed protein product [Clonostachys rosea f. rosea IK726]|uniref:Uncharacterized protein n=1 Tax=Clonostachys rosea f. rosea IK726 TaxID=1349383 RepID=A0ACA9T930_BIOOC|nr:unnamed protein product [Clonostachys rosea f. rosea IK726]
MAISQRLSPAHSKGVGLNKPLAQAQPKTKPKLLLASDMPSWYATNAFLRTGYRPVNGSVKLCFESLRHIHNETVNIYSHLIPAVIAIACNCFLHLYFHSRFPDARLADRLAVHIYLTTSIFCFGIWNRWDYAGIIVQTTGSFVSGVYMTFYCEPALRKLYWTMASFNPHPFFTTP